MRLDADFDSLDTYMSVYGVHVFSKNMLKVYLKDGLGVSLGLRDIFSRRYFYDPWSGNKYSEVRKVDGLLIGRLENSEEWVEYKDKTISAEVPKYEYVGDCWFVFEGVSFSKRITAEYTADRKGSTGNEIVEEFGSRAYIDQSSREYLLEGVLNVPPGPGWMSWEIHAKLFHIEIPDV
ncbi:hypothetical protein H3222_22055 [Pseudomonas chengduensis]|jgi:hypothetical protein|nr:hypothetical protein [Pseudomonas chengduensis]MBG0847885.1 hypothetical protein [Pseudomonas chengduensis]